jgi:hypothetical protein
MANSNGKITAPVSIYDIQQVLGSSEIDLGTLCKRDNINMWAKYKPVIRANRIDTTKIPGTSTSALDTNDAWKPTTAYTTPYSYWWAADDTNHGLVVPFVNVTWSPQGFLDALNTIAGWIDGGLNHWTYNRPTGGTAAPYRQIDFNGYNHKAPQPIKATSGSPQVVAAIDQAWTYGMSMMIPMPTAYDDRDYIIPTDLKIDNTIWQTLYEGIAIYRKVGNTYDAVAWVNGDQWNGYGIIYSDQSDAPVISGGSAVQARFKDGGTYYAIPVYFTKGDLAQPNDGYSFIGNNGSNIKVIPVPYVNFLSFTAVQRSSSQAIGMPVISNREVTRLGYLTTNVSLDATRDGYNGGTASTVRVSVVNQDWNGTPASGNYAYDNTFNNVTVANNTVQLVVALQNIAIDYLTKSGWRIIVSVNGEETTIGLITPAVQTPVQSNQ